MVAVHQLETNHIKEHIIKVGAEPAEQSGSRRHGGSMQNGGLAQYSSDTIATESNEAYGMGFGHGTREYENIAEDL